MKRGISINKIALIFVFALLIMLMWVNPLSVYADPAEQPYEIDKSYSGAQFTKISICADLHLRGQGIQNNRPRFERYLEGIQEFGPQIIILCGDQFEGEYIPPEEGDYFYESGIGIDFDDPYTEIRALAEYYHPGIPLVFISGNNDYTDPQWPNGSYQEFSGYQSHYGLVETKYFDIFRFGAPSAGYPNYPYSDDQVEVLDYYLEHRVDKTKPVLIAGHYPLDDSINTPTNDSNSLRNADNADEIISIIGRHDQPIIFLWGHNHDRGPDEKNQIIKTYARDPGSYYVFTTLNAGAVAYRQTTEYVQGVDLSLDIAGNYAFDYSVKRYNISGEEKVILSGEYSVVSELPWKGKGTQNDPYQISEAAHLIYLANSVNNGDAYSGEFFIQTKDINLEGINWIPIGRYVSSDPGSEESNRNFSGTYDGNGHIISNLGISENANGTDSSNKAYGLFGYLTGTIKNLGLTDAAISVEIAGTYNVYAGGLAGYAGYYDSSYIGKIENSFVEGNVYAKAGAAFDQRCAAGGLVGYLRRGEMKNCYSAAIANKEGGSNNSGAGGLAGWFDTNDAQAHYCYWNKDITDIAGEGNGVASVGMTTVDMKNPDFVRTLNEYEGTGLPSGYKSWMSDQYTSLNKGYPIYNRLVAPVIITDPSDVSSVPNDMVVKVRLSTDAGAEIYYTTNGTDPKSGTLYTDVFDVSTSEPTGETVTVKAVAKIGEDYSAVAQQMINFEMSSGEPWDQGEGTESNPYKISKKEHLIYLANTVNAGNTYQGKFFIQMADINLEDINWVPIGKYVSSDPGPEESNRNFSGTYDGNGHIISNLGISENANGTDSSNKAYGLFGYLTGTIKNLGLTDAVISVEIVGTYNVYAGGLAGYAGYYDSSYIGKIENSFVEGNVYAKAGGTAFDQRCAAGGLVGYLRRGEMKNCYSAAIANKEGGSNNSGAGGLAGWFDINDAQAHYCYWNKDITDIAGGGSGVSSVGMTTDDMKNPDFVRTLNKYDGTGLPSGYKSWMSDQYTSINKGYPIYNRLVAPTIITDPSDVTSVPNKADVKVTIKTATTSAIIYYTVDGTDPTVSGSRVTYQSEGGGFTVNTSNPNGETITIKAVAYLADGNLGKYSQVTEKTITFVKADKPGDGGGSSGGGGMGEVLLPLEIINKDLPDAAVGVEYYAKLLAKGGSNSGYVWDAAGLPDGMKIDPKGFINGIPAEPPGTFSIELTLKDANNKSTAAKLTIKVLSRTDSMFTDIEGHWAKNAIQKASAMGFVKGYGDGTFRPDRVITRAEFITMLVAAFRLEGKGESEWDDVERHWAKGSIQIAEFHGIAKGFSDRDFGPDVIITREQLASLLIRTLKPDPLTGITKFADSGQISEWAASDIYMAVEKGLVRGYPDNTFMPGRGATRAEAIEVILNALSLLDQ